MNYSDWSEDTKEKNRVRVLANYHRKAAAKRSAPAEKAMQDRRRAVKSARPVRRCLECGAELPEGHHPVDYCDWKEYRAHFKREYGAVEMPFLPACERRRR